MRKLVCEWWMYNPISAAKRQHNEDILEGLSPFSQGNFPNFPIPLKKEFSEEIIILSKRNHQNNVETSNHFPDSGCDCMYILGRMRAVVR
jgi:hypothetical protein